MAVEEVQNALKCLKKHGAMNTFRLARVMGIERHEIFNIIKQLEEKGLIEFRHGRVKLSGFMPKIRAEHKIEFSADEKLREQSKHIERLKKSIRALQQKVNISPKVITKTVVKTVVKEIIKKVPVKAKEKKDFNFGFIKKIQLLKIFLRYFSITKKRVMKMAKKGKVKWLTLNMDYTKIGQWAFLIGILIAVVAGFVAIPYLEIILIVAGLAVGLLNITTKERHEFLTSSIALLLVGVVGLNTVALVATAELILKNIVFFIAPAALVVALNSIWSLAKSA